MHVWVSFQGCICLRWIDLLLVHASVHTWPVLHTVRASYETNWYIQPVQIFICQVMSPNQGWFLADTSLLTPDYILLSHKNIHRIKYIKRVYLTLETKNTACRSQNINDIFTLSSFMDMSDPWSERVIYAHLAVMQTGTSSFCILLFCIFLKTHRWKSLCSSV